MPAEEVGPFEFKGIPGKIRVFKHQGNDKFAPGKWYVIHSYAGFERKVKANIEQRKSTLEVEEEIYQIEVPMEDVVEIKNGQRKLVTRVRIPPPPGKPNHGSSARQGRATRQPSRPFSAPPDLRNAGSWSTSAARSGTSCRWSRTTCA